MIEQIKIIQCNLNKSKQATESTLQLAIELGVQILAVQEPWVPYLKEGEKYQGAQSISHPCFIQISSTSNDNSIRPRTMLYLSKQLDLEVSILSEYPDDPDILAASFKNKKYNFNIINIYNQKNQKNENNLTTIERYKNNLQVQPRSIVLGDFNEHHPDRDPQQPKSNLADNLKGWFEKQGLSLVDKVGVSTFYRPNMVSPSTIDLTLTTATIERHIQDWQTITTGSDHRGIMFTFEEQGDFEIQSFSGPIRFNTEKADVRVLK
ncbi:hypothetical protein K3495_g8518 [Podosphaera aphanis]|nr:hypothetical protein K3495_g8518 [Podosphaera aphanis]